MDKPEERTDAEIDKLYDIIDKEMRADPSGEGLNFYLQLWCTRQDCGDRCIQEESTDCLLALLTATLPMKDRVPERKRIYSFARALAGTSRPMALACRPGKLWRTEC